MDNFNKHDYDKPHNVIKVILFAVILVVTLCLFDYFSFHAPLMGYINKLTVTYGGRFGTEDIEPAISTVSAKDPSTKLVLGDSVAGQLFSPLMNNNSDYLLCPTNAALTTAGQYVLARIYLENHPDATDIYLVMYPGSLAADIDPAMSYQYVVLPFYENGYADYLEGMAKDKLEAEYGRFFLRQDVLRFIDYSGVNRKLFLNALSKRTVSTDDTDISELSVYYLKKLYELGESYDVSVHLLSDPVADIDLRHEQQANFRSTFAETGLDEMYPNYCDSIIYCPEDYFLEDKVHFNDEHHNRETLNPLIMQMSEMDESVSGLAGVFTEE